MKVLQVLNTLRLDHGGPTYSVSHLARALQILGGDVELHILGESSLASDFPVRVQSYAQSRLAMWRGLRSRAHSTQVLHSHGLWKFPNFVSALVAGKSKCHHVISPRGMLARDSMGQKPLRKRIALSAWQKKALESASVLHATSEMELADFRSVGLKGPACLIPNGIDIPVSSKGFTPSLPRRILFMGRMAPLKRIDELLKAWSQTGPERAEWELHIVGPGDEYRVKLKTLCHEIRAPRVFFHGPVREKERDEWYRRAELLVLPSARAENFGLVVAEALAHGTPVIASTATPWQSVQKENCGWWTDCDSNSLAKTLREATSLSPQQLHEKGLAGHQWVAREFGWDRVGKMMIETYRWVLGETPKPDWIYS